MNQDPEVSSWQEVEELRTATENAEIEQISGQISDMLRDALHQAEAINEQKRLLQEELGRDMQLADTYDKLMVAETHEGSAEVTKLMEAHAQLTRAEEWFSKLNESLTEIRLQNISAKYRCEKNLALREEEQFLRQQLEEKGVFVEFKSNEEHFQN